MDETYRTVVESLQATQPRDGEHVAVIYAERLAVGGAQVLVKRVVGYSQRGHAGEDVVELVNEVPRINGIVRQVNIHE